MAGGGNSMHRVISYVRFAVRTSKRIEDISHKASQKKQELAEQIKDFSKDMECFKKQ